MKKNREKTKKGFSFSDLSLNEYESVFVIDATDDSYVEYSASDSDTQLVVHGYGDNFFLDIAENLRSQVWEEDRGYFVRTFNKTAILESMRGGKTYSIRFRLDLGGTPLHYLIKTISSTDHSIILGIMNMEYQIQQEQAVAAERAAYKEMAEALTGLFEVLYQIDPETGSYTEFHVGESLDKPGKRRSGEDFFAQVQEDIPKQIHPDDCAMLTRELDRETLLSNLRRSPTVSLSYRKLRDGQIQYVSLLAFCQKGSERLVIGVRNVDAQKKLESEEETLSQIAGALASRYEAIYYVDIINDTYTRYGAGESYTREGKTVQGADFFRSAGQDICAGVHPDDRERVLAQFQKTALLRDLSLSGTVTLTYRQVTDGRELYLNVMVVRPKSDPRHIVAAVLNVDAQVRRELSMMTESQAFGEIAKALAQRYEVIYRVDPESGEYTEYCANEKYARLKPGEKGTDFFGDTQRNLKTDIYPEDYPMMTQAMRKDNLLDRLQETGKYILNYRLMVDGRPQYVTLFAVRPKEDSSHIIAAVANVDTAMPMEAEREETASGTADAANRDPLTGVKNKRAYVQAEAELNALINDKKNPGFAVVVCDINGLSVSSTQGADAVDEHVLSACRIICDTFKHSPVFRVGSDEFVVLLKGMDFEHRKQLMQQLSIISLQHSQSGMVTLSSGLSEFNRRQDHCVQDVFERADAAMFESKKRFKSAFRR